MRLKPSELIALKADTVKRAIDTIGNRIDQLGLAEKSVQQYGQAGADYEILVQLPGVDDPARVKDLIGTAAVLEIDDVKDGPFASQGCRPGAAWRRIAAEYQAGAVDAARRVDRATWYLVSKSPVISGREMRNARPGQDEFRKWETNFTLSPDGGKRFGRYTEANIGNKLAVVLDNKIVSVATIQSKIEDSGPHHRPGQRAGGGGSVALPAVRFPAGRRASIWRSDPSAPRWAPIPFTRASWRVSPG